MPGGWKRLASIPVRENSNPGLPLIRKRFISWIARAPGNGLDLGGTTSDSCFDLRINSLCCFALATIENFLLHGNISLAPLITPAVILCIIVYAVRRTRGDEQILRDGVLTPGVITGWYDKTN